MAYNAAVIQECQSQRDMTGRHGDLDCARCRPPLPRRSALAAIIYYPNSTQAGPAKGVLGPVERQEPGQCSAICGRLGTWCERGAGAVFTRAPSQLPCHCAVGAADSAPPARSLLSAV